MTAEITQVHPAQLTAWLGSQPASAVLPVLLDVREPWELARASVKPAQCTFKALPMAQVPLRLSELDPQTPVAVLCHHGARSMQVAHFLARNGFSTVANISGGIAVWASEFDATVPQY